MKIVINECFGGFGVSRELIERARSEGVEWAKNPNTVLCGETFSDGSGPLLLNFNSYDPEINGNRVPRHNPDLVRLVEELGDKSNGECSRLSVVEIPTEDPDGYTIDEYDGMESVHAAPAWAI